MDNKPFDAQESIRLIEQTLRRSAQNMEEHSGKPLVLWGYVTVLSALAVYFSAPYLGGKAHLLWCLIPVLGYPLAHFLGCLGTPSQLGQGFVSRFLRILWLVIGLSNCVVGFYLGFVASASLGAWTTPLVLAYVSLSCSMAMFITGTVLSIRVYQVAAVAGLLYLLLSATGVLAGMDYSLSFAALSFVQMCLVGHYLLYKVKK